MISGNEPAMPIVADEKMSIYADMPGTMMSCQHFGLTIRQQAIKDFASALIIAKPQQIHNPKEGMALAAEWADAFIAELNKPA